MDISGARSDFMHANQLKWAVFNNMAVRWVGMWDVIGIKRAIQYER